MTNTRQKHWFEHPLTIPLLTFIFTMFLSHFSSIGYNILPHSMIKVLLLIVIPLLATIIVHFSVKENNLTVGILSTILVSTLGIAVLYLTFVLIVILTTYPISNRYEYAQNATIALMVIVATSVPLLCLRAKSEHLSTKRTHTNDNEEHEYAVTGTCIPFAMEKNSSFITAYMINKVYQLDSGETKNDWMFPGGHAFHADDSDSNIYLFSPDGIAVKKALSEAGLTVKLLDYDTKKLDVSDRIENFEFRFPPHHTYLFHQDKHVRCYHEKGHKHHYDVVFICEVSTQVMDSKYPVAEIKLTGDNLTQDDISASMNKGIASSCEKRNITSNASYTKDSYQVIMLYNAYNDYLKAKKQEVI